jgi:hypothetical protein
VTFRILLSYHYFKGGELHEQIDRWFPHGKPEIFADSGAYSAMTQNAPIELTEYAGWITRNRDLFDVYANLDVIGDGNRAAEATWENQKRLEGMGLKPLPVFHAGENFDVLERLLAAGYGYIALGGLVGRKAANTMPWLVKCFQLAEGKAVFHGFGLTTWGVIAALPFYSVDSTSWGTSFTYGRLSLFDEAKGAFMIAHLSQYGTVYKERAAELIRSYGFNPADFAIKERYSRARTCQLSALSWQRGEAWLRRRHGPVAVPNDRTRPEGLRWYCADGSINNLADAAEGIRLYLADTCTTNFATLGKLDKPKEVPIP